MDYGIRGRKAIVCAASQGLGKGCALALARNEGEARRVLLGRLPTLEHERLRGHTGGNLRQPLAAA